MTDSDQPENTLVSGEGSTGIAKSPTAMVGTEPPTRDTAQHVPLVEQAAVQDAGQSDQESVPTDVVLTGQVPVDDRVIGKPQDLSPEQAKMIRDKINEARVIVMADPEPEPVIEEPEPEPEPEPVNDPVDPDAVPQSMGGASTEPRGPAPDSPAPDSTDTPIFDSVGGTQ